MCMLLCAIVFSSALFAEAADSNKLVAQQSSKSRNSKNNNGPRNPNSWRPYYMNLKAVEPAMTSFYQQNVGIGFLYFSGINGNLAATTNNAFIKSNKKITGHLSYNRTPLIECIIGRDIFRWWKIGLSYQHQGGVVVQSRPQVRPSSVVGTTFTPVDFSAHVKLDAVMVKTYFMLPWVLVWKNVYHESYLGLGVGPGWQSWVNIKTPANFAVSLRPKYSANCVFTVDLGCKLRKALPNYIMSFTLGCKYNQWGQARSMGKLRDQYPSSATTVAAGGNGSRAALSNPLRIKTVYQFAPYVGVAFNF